MSTMALYPLFLKLAGRKVLVVGGGPVALGKVRALVEAGAEVAVVAPEVVPELAVLPADLEAWTAEAERQRAAWHAARVPMTERRPLLLEALNRLYEERRGGAKVRP